MNKTFLLIGPCVKVQEPGGSHHDQLRNHRPGAERLPQDDVHPRCVPRPVACVASWARVKN